MGLLDDDLDFILSDQVGLTEVGVVVWGAQHINATFDREERLQTDASGNYLPRLTTLLRVATADLPSSAAREDSITIDKVSYRVRSVEPIGDGLISEVLVARG